MNARLALLLTALLPIAACTAQDAAPAATPNATTAATAAATTASAATPATAAPAAIDPAAAAAAQAAATAAASGPAPVAGVDYIEIPNGQPFQPANGKIEVVEVFGYTCPHCASFEPLIGAWKAKLPDDVRFTYVPAPFGGYWIPYAKAYYAAEALGLVDDTHDAMFRALHIERSLPIANVAPEEIAAFYARHGADAEQFAATMQSFGIDAKLKRAAQFLQASGVDGTPTLIVNGKYRVLGTSLQEHLRIANQLIAMERAAQPAAQP